MILGNYTSILSQLIYDCQILILAQVFTETEDDITANISTRIIKFRDQWLLNDTDGPVAELLENRLLGFFISRQEVPPAQLRWHEDGETLVWVEVIFHLTDLRTMIFQGLEQAQKIFTEELCLNRQSSLSKDIPTLNLSLLVNN